MGGVCFSWAENKSMEMFLLQMYKTGDAKLQHGYKHCVDTPES